MSQRTLFKCDRCGGEWEQHTKECPQAVNIVVKLNYGNHYPVGDEGYSGTLAHNQTWCRPCLDSSGVVIPKVIPDIPVQPPAPSVETIIVDLLNRLGFTQME
jgi:hypothetical protein